MHVIFSAQKAKVEDVIKHLLMCDEQFVNEIKKRVFIDEYAKKIVNNALTFEAWHDNELIALLAIYCNSTDQLSAHITNVSVLPEWSNKGIASRLMDSCITSVINTEYKGIELEVNKYNKKAMDFYAKFDFIKLAGNESMVRMKKIIKGIDSEK